MKREIKLWWIRNFRIISAKQAKELGLTWYRNIYGDEINRMDCRSFWIDSKRRGYRVLELMNLSHE